MAEICSNADIEEVALAEIKNHSLKCHLVKFEIPNAIKFISDIWTPESGLVTSSFKLKRKQIENRYKSIIDIMYSKTT